MLRVIAVAAVFAACTGLSRFTEAGKECATYARDTVNSELHRVGDYERFVFTPITDPYHPLHGYPLTEKVALCLMALPGARAQQAVAVTFSDHKVHPMSRQEGEVTDQFRPPL